MAAAPDIQQQVFNLLSRASNISFVSAEQRSGEVSFLTSGQCLEWMIKDGVKVTVPVHGTHDIKIKTLLSIEKQSGVKLK